MVSRLLLGLLVVCACDAAPDEPDASVAPRDAGHDAAPPADFDGFVEWHLRAGGIPGAALSIVRGTEIEWIGTYGLADREAGRAVDERTLFTVASISKTITVTRAMQLVESGALDLDAPIEVYVGYAVRHPAHPDVPISARMLLAHVAGLEDTWGMLAEASVSGADPSETLTGFASGYVAPGGAYYADGNWGERPGTAHAYCNAAFALVGDAIERAGGASFRAQTSAGLFEPLAMDGAGFFLADVDASRLAIGYGHGPRGYARQEHGGFAFYPASSLRVSIVGLSRFLLAIANGGALDGARVLDPASVGEMLRPQVPGLDRGQALSWSERRVGGHPYVGHSGASLEASAQMLLSREGTHGVVLLTNGDAYVRARLGLREGEAAMEAILERLDARARGL